MATDQNTKARINALLREREGYEQRLNATDDSEEAERLTINVGLINDELKDLGYKTPKKSSSSSKKKESKS